MTVLKQNGRQELTYEFGILAGWHALIALIAAAALKVCHLDSLLAELVNLPKAVAPPEELWLQGHHSHRGQRGQGR